MHLYAIVRGKRSLVRRVKEDLEEIFIPWQNSKHLVQLVPRKVELVEFVFPEENLAQVTKTLTGWEDVPKDTTRCKKGGLAWGIRKALGLQAIPKMDLKKIDTYKVRSPPENVGHKFVQFHPIGIKKDKRNKDGVELL